MRLNMNQVPLFLCERSVPDRQPINYQFPVEAGWVCVFVVTTDHNVSAS